MKFALSANTFFSAVLWTYSASATVLSADFLGSTAKNVPAAAYFMTNEPSGNFIVSANIGSDGKLSLVKAISTGGIGAHGHTSPIGPDALFSQGSVEASASGKVLATVNAGSNTISMFSINPDRPADIQMVGEPVSSEGEFPVSLAINKNGTMLCALNGGTVNGINCFRVDPKKGLSSIPNTLRSLGLNQTTPATGPPGTVSHVIFSEDGKQLIASVKGMPNMTATDPAIPGFLAVWDVNADDSLSQNFKQVAPAKGGLLPFSMTIIPGMKAILATDPGVGFDIFDLAQGATNSSRSSAVPIEGQGATCWSSFSKETGNFYLTDVATSLVTEVSVNKNLNGSIVKQYAQTNNSGTIDNEVASIGGKDFRNITVYVLSANATKIDVLSLNAPGQAQHIQSIDLAAPAKGAGLPINPNYLQGMTTFVKEA